MLKCFLNLDRDTLTSQQEQFIFLFIASTSQIIATQSRLIEIHRKLIQDNDEDRIANSTPSEVTEFSLESYLFIIGS